MTDLSAVTLQRLDAWAAIAVTGADSKSFLQGQLSFDLDRLTPSKMELASCSSAQGRVQAVVWLIERSDAVLMILPASMVDALLPRLRKFVLRAKAKFEVSERFAVFAAHSVEIEGPPQAHVEHGERSYVRWPGERVMCVAPRASGGSAAAELASRWRRADIAAGLPQVYPQTHEAFVAQMLNLDVLGGIGFEKGCYTGQEIIARMHFRGTVKRRMLRFAFSGAAPEPGTRILSVDQHAGDVVDAVSQSGDGELLAVVSLAHAQQALCLDTSDRAALTPLPLPYQL